MKQTTYKNVKRLRGGLISMLALLVVQFIVGMYLNFYTEIAGTHPGTNGSYAPSIPWALAGHAGPALAVHVTLWILLMLGAITLLVRAIMSKHKALIINTSLGLFFILMASSGGLTFLNRGGNDQQSFMMAIGFILAFIAYGAAFYKTKEQQI